MKTKNEIFRSIAFSLQIISICTYFMPTLVMGGEISIFWLALGVIHTIVFCTIFFRNSRKRRVLSVLLLITVILSCVPWVLVGYIMWAMNASLIVLIVYFSSRILAAIFALANPRKLPESINVLM